MVNGISQERIDELIEEEKLKRKLRKPTERMQLRQSTELTLKQTKRELGTRRRLEKKERKGKQILRAVRRRRSIGGRIGSAVEGGFEFGRKGLTRTLQERDRPQANARRVRGISKAGGVRTGKRGRPKGTVKFTDPRTGRPIGVFEHRKIQAQRRRLEVINARQRAAVTPRQQQVLRQLEARDRQQGMSRERRVVPGTGGQVGIMGIMDEIDSAANIVS